MKNSGGFIQIILVLIVLALVGGAYYFGTQKNKSTVSVSQNPVVSTDPSANPTSDPTVNWKTYSKYSVSFKYPNNISVDDVDSEINNILNIGYTDDIASFKNVGYISGSPYFIQVEYYQPLAHPELPSQYSKIIKKEEIQVNGQKVTIYLLEATEIAEEVGVGDRVEVALFKNYSSFSRITLLKLDQKQVFDQILSTFKFTK